MLLRRRYPLTARFLEAKRKNSTEVLQQEGNKTMAFPLEHTLRACLYGLGYPETTLPPSYPGRAIFLLISSKSSIYRLHEVDETTRVGRRQLGEASCLASARRVTLASGATFSLFLAYPGRDRRKLNACVYEKGVFVSNFWV